MLRLEDCFPDRLKKLAKSEDLNVLLPAGVGDCLWALSKLEWLTFERRQRGQRVVFHLPDGEQHRAGHLFEMLGLNCAYLPGLTTRWIWDRPGSPPIPEAGWFSAHANAHLEAGHRIEDWYPDIPFAYPKPRTCLHDTTDRPFVLLMTGERGYMMGNLMAQTWAHTASRLQHIVGAVRFVGAGKDVEFIEEIGRLQGYTIDDYWRAQNILDKPLEYVYASFRNPNCRCIVGVASGITIAATVEGVPSLIAYPRHLNLMPSTWEPRAALSQGRTRFCYVNELEAEVGAMALLEVMKSKRTAFV